MSNQKVWFITGASKGLGLALTKLVLSQGNKVIATSRNIDDLKESITEDQDNFFPLSVDITSDQDVKNAIEQGIEKFGRIDVVVNNAGYKKWSEYSGKQIGDPEKLVKILTEIVALENPPKRLLLGTDTYQLIKEHREKEMQEFETWKHLTLSTDFD